MVHEEVDRIAMSSAPIAVVMVIPPLDHEGGDPLLMKGTAGFKKGACFGKLDIRREHLYKVDPLPQAL
jgi:hypothetical protein